MPPKFRPKQKKRKGKSKADDKPASGAGGDAAAAERHKSVGNKAFSARNFDAAVSALSAVTRPTRRRVRGLRMGALRAHLQLRFVPFSPLPACIRPATPKPVRLIPPTPQITAYTAGIEADPTAHVLFSNRSAAHFR